MTQIRKKIGRQRLIPLLLRNNRSIHVDLRVKLITLCSSISHIHKILELKPFPGKVVLSPVLSRIRYIQLIFKIEVVRYLAAVHLYYNSKMNVTITYEVTLLNNNKVKGNINTRIGEPIDDLKFKIL